VLKIYGQARSRAFRVLWLCKESGIAYEHIPVTIHVDNAQAKEDWYRALNPNARIPTIDDDGFVMWESSAINLYLAEKYASPLWPATVQGRGRMLQWALYIANDVEGPMIQVFQHRFAFPPEKRVPAIADDGEQKMRPKLDLIDKTLAGRGFLGLDRWDMADFIAASVLYSLVGMKYDLSPWPNLKAWLETSASRPAAVEAIRLRG
jgi:glutathione S-transferase